MSRHGGRERDNRVAEDDGTVQHQSRNRMSSVDKRRAEGGSDPIAVAALVVLAGRLPGHAEPGRDFWPPDAQADGVVDEHHEFGLCRFPREPDAFDPLQHLGRRQLRNSLRRC
ncbi:MAG TPA: hypothetical protein VEH31_01930 [Streptosporangiaceae bacterium]|nr:hypothetical protein [Streptosporangiaceae bacterium]